MLRHLWYFLYRFILVGLQSRGEFIEWGLDHQDAKQRDYSLTSGLLIGTEYDASGIATLHSTHSDGGLGIRTRVTVTLLCNFATVSSMSSSNEHANYDIEIRSSRKSYAWWLVYLLLPYPG